MDQELKTKSEFHLRSGKAFSDLNDDEVLFFIRIKGKKQYFNLFYPNTFLKEFKSLNTYRTISEYTKDADIVIDFSKYSMADIRTRDYEIIDQVLNIDDVIKRCRGLRAISMHEARALVFFCSKFFIEFFEGNPKLKLIVAGCVDNYVMDIMFKFAEHYSVQCLGITDFFLFPKYKLVTNYGEANEFYEPTENEIDDVLGGLLNKKTSPLAISSFKAYKNAFRYFISYHYRFLIRYCFFYKICGRLGYEYRFAPYLKAFHTLRQLLQTNFYFHHFDIEFIKRNKDRIVYIPLHWYPEATIDYWTDHPDKANYFESIYKVVRFFQDKGLTVVLKEHPAFFLCREIDFYKMIRKFDNVILLNPFVRTQNLLDCINNVVVWNGSTGIEALMIDKDIYCTTESYYSHNALPYYTEFGNPRKFSIEDKRMIVKGILKTSLPVT
jgi:hypothetical protein